MMQKNNRLAVIFLASLLALFLVACSGDEDDKKDEAKPKTTPEFISTPAAARTGGGTLPEPVFVGSGAAPPSISIGPVQPPVIAALASGATAAASGITVRHTETATLPADQAFVVAMLQSMPGPGPFTPGLSGRQQEQVTTALTGLGVRKEDISFETSPNIGPFPSVSVPVPIADLQTRGRQIIDAIESAVGTRPQSGARFALSDCRTALDPLRKQAIEATNQEATALADASSLSLGAMISISQSVNSQSSGGPPMDPCAGGAGGGPRTPGSLAALDSEPRVTLNLQIEATYAIGSGTAGADGGLTLSGAGKATAKADEAYIIVTVYNSSGTPFGPQPVSKKTRDELVARLKTLNFDEDDIQVETGFGGPGQTIVSVDAPLNDLPKTGRDVVAAVEDILGRSQSQGVWFTHSNCAAVLNEARKQAIAEAKRSAEALAGSASIKLGNLTSISEGSSANIAPYGLAVQGPCSENVAAMFQGGGGPYGGVSLKPFDSAAEFTINSTISVTYAIAP